jgi:hypothetical protein
MSTILAALGSVAGIVGAVYGVFKWVTWQAQKTEDQINQDVDAQVKSDSTKEQNTGRPA